MTTPTVAVTGASGFVGRNLATRLAELLVPVQPITRESTDADWHRIIAECDVVVHLAAANRPDDEADFDKVNCGTARLLAAAVEAAGRPKTIIYSSSTRAGADDAYGKSKRESEDLLRAAAERTGSSLYVFRLPNVFGKWSRPFYNSAVATFCHQVARGEPVTIHDPSAPLTLIYIDDVVDAFLRILAGDVDPGLIEAGPVYQTSVGEVATTIEGFRTDRSDDLIAEVGKGLVRALYATYVAALPTSAFSYALTSHRDQRGAFSEFLKTRTSGQFSYFTALPGVTRGGHYHHTKTEKFLVVHGSARFRFRHMLSGEMHEIITSGESPVVVETVPGWTHDITNVGEDVLISMLWANEIFDRQRPDTIAAEV